MSTEYITNDTDLKSVADAIRAKTGKTDPLTFPDEFASEIAGIEAGGGSDISLGLTGAAVGQIAKITAVDKNGVPTAWSPVNMPSGGSGGDETWELLADITAEEDTNTILITEGLSSFKKLWLELYTFATAATQTMIGMNGALASSHCVARVPYEPSGGRAFAGYIEKLPNGYWGGHGMYRLHKNGSDENTPIPGRFIDGTWPLTSFVHTDVHKAGTQTVTSLRIYQNVGVMKAGTKVFIYGVKA